MKRIPIIILITASILCACLFLGTCDFIPQKEKPDKQAFIETEKEIDLIDKDYQEAFVLLKTHSDSLEKELNVSQSKLKIVKVNLKQSQHALLKLAKKDTDSVSIAERLTDYDSLKTQTLSFVDLVDTSNCMYETTITQLQNLLATKDSQIVVCRASYAQLKSLVDVNMERERKLTADLQTAYKSQRRKVFQNKLLAGGMLLLSGISTTLYINANK